MGFSSARALFVCAALVGCQSHRAPFATTGSGTSLSKRDGGSDLLTIPQMEPPPPDAGGLCGNVIVPIVSERPNFYFVIDASGSMTQPMDTPTARGLLPSRYDAAGLAIANLLMSLGHRVSYGAALFPGELVPDGDTCPPGTEIFPTQPGDSVSYAVSKKIGPRLNILLNTLSAHSPTGLTPTAASLEALKPQLLALEGTTYAFLLTDGAPNCNVRAGCDADSCTPNIEGGCGQKPGVNCCDPKLGLYDSRWCLDADPTVGAIEDLALAGIKTFVIGMPGTDMYATLLGRMATAGGTARETEPLYYPASGADDLTETLRKIALSVTVSCDVALAQPAPEKRLVNVYFDKVLVPLDDANGWQWVTDSSVRITGESCQLLRNGDVLQVQVVAGCPTVTR